MPAQKSTTPAPAAKPQKAAAKAVAPKANPVTKPVPKSASITSAPFSAKPAKTPTAAEAKKAAVTAAAVAAAELNAKKKPGRPAKAVAAEPDVQPGAKRGRKPKAAGPEVKGSDDADMSDIEADLVGEPVVTGEKVKPLRMKISKAKERALMKEFGLDDTILSEEDMAKRRQRLKALIKLGKTRGYLTHGEISDHLPDKLIDAETMESVITTLNDLGVAVYEQTPDAESLILTNSAPAGATEEEAEEAAEAALSTVDSEFGRTTDPVRMYMREMGTV